MASTTRTPFAIPSAVRRSIRSIRMPAGIAKKSHGSRASAASSEIGGVDSSSRTARSGPAVRSTHRRGWWRDWRRRGSGTIAAAGPGKRRPTRGLPPIRQRGPEVFLIDGADTVCEVGGKGWHGSRGRVGDRLLCIARAGDHRAHSRQLRQPRERRRRRREARTCGEFRELVRRLDTAVEVDTGEGLPPHRTTRRGDCSCGDRPPETRSASCTCRSADRSPEARAR